MYVYAGFFINKIVIYRTLWGCVY